MAKYKIVGPRKVQNSEPGTVIEILNDKIAKTLIKAGHIKPTTIKRTRARKTDGTYKSDDKSTPNINEAWVEEE